jgi:transposase-like protein
VANLALLMDNARSVIKRLRFPLDIMLLCVRWYVAYALSLRNLEEIMQERGLFVDHSTIHRWVIKLSWRALSLRTLTSRTRLKMPNAPKRSKFLRALFTKHEKGLKPGLNF